MIYQPPGRELRSVEEALPDRPVFERKPGGRPRVLMVPEPVHTAKNNALGLKLSAGELTALRNFFRDHTLTPRQRRRR